MLLYMYIAPGQGRKRLEDKLLTSNRDKCWCQQKALNHIAHLLQVLKQSLWIMILNTFLMISYMYIPGTRADNPLGTNFWCQQKALITLPISCMFKKKLLWSPILYTFFSCFMYIALGRGRQSTGDKILMTTEGPFLFAHMLQVSKWSLWNLILYTFLMILYMYSPGARAENTLRTNFWRQQKAFITSTTGCKFQTNLFEFWFYTHIF